MVTDDWSDWAEGEESVAAERGRLEETSQQREPESGRSRLGERPWSICVGSVAAWSTPDGFPDPGRCV